MQDATAIREDLIVGGYGWIDGDLPVFTGSSWEDHVQAWIDAEDEVSEGRWKQAAVAASLVTHYGEQSVEEFARQIGVHFQRVYESRNNHALKMERLQRLEFSDRSENSNLSWNHYTQVQAINDRQERHALLDLCESDCLSTKALVRLVKQAKAPDIDAPAGHTLSDNPHIQAKWEQFQKAAQELVGVAPHLTGAMRVALEEIGYEISRPSETNRELIFNALSEGVDEIDEIAKHIHKHRDFVTRWMNSLADEGLVRSFQKERAPTSRGAKRTGWEIV